MIGDQKWVVYNNVIARGHGAERMNQLKAFQKPAFTKKRWCYLFDEISKESFFFRTFTGQYYDTITTINSDVYCHQLYKLNDALRQERQRWTNRKGVVLHQDNTSPYTSFVTGIKLLQLGRISFLPKLLWAGNHFTVRKMSKVVGPEWPKYD